MSIQCPPRRLQGLSSLSKLTPKICLCRVCQASKHNRLLPFFTDILLLNLEEVCEKTVILHRKESPESDEEGAHYLVGGG